MYKVFFNHRTKGHSIINVDKLVNIEDEDVEVFGGSIDECKSYLSPLSVIYLTVL